MPWTGAQMLNKAVPWTPDGSHLMERHIRAKATNWNGQTVTIEEGHPDWSPQSWVSTGLTFTEDGSNLLHVTPGLSYRARITSAGSPEPVGLSVLML